MAKKWTVAEAYKALTSGDKEARLDIGRRYPLFSTATEAEILSAITTVTVRKVEAKLRGDMDMNDEADGEAEVVKKPEKKGKEKPEKPAKKEKPVKKEKAVKKKKAGKKEKSAKKDEEISDADLEDLLNDDDEDEDEDDEDEDDE